MNSTVLGVAVIAVGVLFLIGAYFVLTYGLSDEFHRGGGR